MVVEMKFFAYLLNLTGEGRRVVRPPPIPADIDFQAINPEPMTNYGHAKSALYSTVRDEFRPLNSQNWGKNDRECTNFIQAFKINSLVSRKTCGSIRRWI
jgi:hypothetical protein